MPLVGDSHTWAAAVIMLLGALACGLGSAQQLTEHKVASTLGALALVLAALALVTGSLTPLSLLVADIVALWAVATFDHVRHATGRPIAA